MLLSGSSYSPTSTTGPLNLRKNSALIRNGALVLSGNLLLIVCSHVAVPHLLTPVPSTLQTFAVMFLALSLGPSLSAAAVCAYLLEGALGAPVFAPPFSAGGLAHLLGPTGGFLLAYLPASLLSSFLYKHLAKIGNRVFAAAAACLAAELPIFLLGALWLTLETHVSFSQAIALSTTPFLAGEAIKILLVLTAFAALVRRKESF